jgi:signal recognition particle subunit SRP54
LKTISRLVYKNNDYIKIKGIKLDQEVIIMILGNLGNSLKESFNKLARSNKIDKKVAEEIIKDIQRALLQADVNVKLVMKLSENIKKRALKEEVLEGFDAKEHVSRIIYEEFSNILGKGTEIALKRQNIMMVGLQGSGKTTTTAKLAKYFQRKGLKTAVIGADTFRPGAFDQLSQLCKANGIPFYGEKGNKNAVELVKNGLNELKEYEVKIVDTAGRHALEDDLIQEMKDIDVVLKPDHKFLVLDAAIGQEAEAQSKKFNEAIGITGVIITKLDGTAKGGGALSAVSETGSGIAFIGVGEKIDDLEKFDPDSFISKLVGLGDLKSLMERVQESVKPDEMAVEEVLKGKFTLKEMYKQFEAINKMGPFNQILQMIPFGGLGIDLKDKDYEKTKYKLDKYKVIMDSMTEYELENPTCFNSSRIRRVAIGSGSDIAEVRELLNYYKTMKKAFGMFKGGNIRGLPSKLMKMFSKGI